MESISDEIIREILSRLPTKSLLRLTSVSKQWRSLISEPYFTKIHVNRLLLDQSENHQRLLVRSYYDSPSTFYSTDYESITYNPVNRKFPLSLLASQRIIILGSSNGLLLVRLLKNSLYLWNPSLRTEFRRLPTSSADVPIQGFGYDSSSDDYKVVRVGSDCGFLNTEAQIYNLKTNSWRTITDIDFPNIVLSFANPEVGGTLVNGSLYWSVYESDYDFTYERYAILGFSLADEKFTLVPLPDEEDSNDRQDSVTWWPPICDRLSVLNGCLAKTQTNSKSSLVWILKEGGEKNEFSWTKLMRIPNAGGLRSLPLCYKKSGELLLSMKDEEEDVDDQLVLYNQENSSRQDYLIRGSSLWLEEHMYIETLVSPRSVR